MAYGRTSGVLGERILRRLINQLSATITAKTPLDKQREVLKQVMSLREELQAAALINRKHYGDAERAKRKARQAKEQAEPEGSKTDA